MSLETRLKAAFERVAATIKQRGLPAGGTAGQVLTKAGGSDYDAGWTTPTASGGHDQTTATITFASAGSQDVPAPYALGIVRKIEFSAAGRVACYPSAAARASDQTRFDGNPTLAPNVPVITQAQALGATTIAINEAYTGTTLYLRSSASCTVTLTIEEA